MKQQQEEALLAAFHKMTNEERRTLICIAEAWIDLRCPKRTPLRLVVTTPPASLKH